MSIEQAILEHAAALREVAAAIKSLTGGVPGALVTIASAPVEEIKAAVADKKPSAEKPTTAAAAVAQAKELAAADKKQASAPAEAAKIFDYVKDVAPVLTEVIAKKGKDAGQALLKDFGAIDPATNSGKGKLLKPEQYGDFIEKCKELLSAPDDETV